MCICQVSLQDISSRRYATDINNDERCDYETNGDVSAASIGKKVK
jgi:hypothetical protein